MLMMSAAALWAAQLRQPRAAISDGAARPLTLAEARPLIAALGQWVPPELRARGGSDGEVGWAAWRKRRDTEIRARVAAGEEDSLVNLMLYGTGFTNRPRATPDAIAAAPGNPTVEDVMEGRLRDLVAALDSPARDERLWFARQVIEGRGIEVGPHSREAIRRHLAVLRSRVLAENERYFRRLAPGTAETEAARRAAEATVYRDRGLASDASLRIGFAIEQAMAALRDRGELRPRSVRRVAVVGPGLDVVDKAQGYDFYPVQTIQPFAITDSLRRLGVADGPAVTALDISPRVIAHLRAARERARRGDPYRLTAVLEHDRPGLHVDPALVEYWRKVGSHIGTDVPLEVPAAHADTIRGRAVDVRPDVVLDVTGTHLNIVLQRLGAGPQLDLAVATNVLLYYEPFEQALAVSNIGSMLRTGGLLITNQPVPLPGSCGLSSLLIVAVAFGRVDPPAGPHDRGDAIYVYRKV